MEEENKERNVPNSSNLDTLLPDTKIIQSINGCLCFEQKCMDQIMESITFKNKDRDSIPVALIGVIGPQQSGKSFMTNLLIQYFRKGGDGGWLEDVIRQEEFEEGFNFGSTTVTPINGGKLFSPETSSKYTSGVYLWPTAYVAKNEDDGSEILVCILHYRLSYQLGNQKKDEEAMEMFLTLACSRVMEINCGEGMVRVAHLRQNLTTSLLISSDFTKQFASPEEICESFVLLMRSESSSSLKTLTDEDAKKAIMELMNSEDGTVLNTFRFLNVVRIKEISGPLHDNACKLDQKIMKSLTFAIKNIVNTMTTYDELRPKSITKGKLLTLSTMGKFLETCVDTINRFLSAKATPTTAVQAQGRKHEALEHKKISREEFFATQCSTIKVPPGVLETNLDDDSELTGSSSSPVSQQVESALAPKLSAVTISSDYVSYSNKNTATVYVHSKEQNSTNEEFPPVGRLTTSGSYENNISGPDVSIDEKANPLAFSSNPEENDYLMETLTDHDFVIIEKIEGKSEEVAMEVDDDPDVMKAVTQLQQESISQGRLNEEKELHHTPEIILQEQEEEEKQRLQEELQESESQSQRIQEELRRTQEKQARESQRTQEEFRRRKDKQARESRRMQEEFRRNQEEQERDSQCMQEQLRQNQEEKARESQRIQKEMQEEFRRNQEKQARESQRMQEEFRRNQEEQERESQRIQEELRRMQEEQEQESRRIQEEQRRKQEQFDKERALIIEEMVPTAIVQVKQMFIRYTEIFILTKLKPSTLHLSSTIYDEVLEETLHECYGKIIPTLHWQYFKEAVDQNCQQICCNYLDDLFKKAKDFNDGIKKQLDIYGYSPLDKYNVMVAEEIAKVLSDMHHCVGTDIHRQVQMACEKLSQIYRDYNSSVMKNEEELQSNAIYLVKNFYNEEMKRYLHERKVFIKEDLSKIHAELVDKLVHGYTKAFNFNTDQHVRQMVLDKSTELRRFLNDDFEAHKASNDTNLKKLQASINKMITEHKMEYIKKIEAILESHSDGYDPKKLENNHKTLSEEQINLLKMRIVREIREDEPTDVHCQSLKHQIELYWNTVKNANALNIAKKQKKDDEMRAEQQKRIEEMRKEQGKAQASKSRLSYSPPVTRSKSRNANASTRGPELPPMIFHLMGNHVVMGTVVDGRFCPMTNEWGEEVTPAIISVGNGSCLIYGKEAQMYIAQNHWVKRWVLADHLISGETPWTETVSLWTQAVPHYIYTINFEFLLGFLLRKLKNFVEKQQNGRCSRALIAIPFWLTSSQRLQIKDGARLAGFSEVLLVNEASAAAYAFASHELRKYNPGNFLVMSESFGRIEAFIFNHSLPRAKKVKMVACYSNEDLIQDGENDGILSSLFNKFMGTEESNPNLPEHHSNTPHKVCKRAFETLEQVQKNAEVNEGFVICHNEKWFTNLRNAFWKKRARVTGTKSCNVLVLEGLAMLSLLAHHSDEMSNFVRDLIPYDVLRNCGGKRNVKVIGKHHPLSYGNQYYCDLPKYENHAILYQHHSSKNFLIGEFRDHTNAPFANSIVPIIRISNDGILAVEDVKFSDSSNCQCIVDGGPKFSWETPNLTKEDFDKIAQTLEIFFGDDEIPIEPERNEEKSELTLAKESLEAQCRSMEKSLENGDFEFKNEVGKQIVTMKISKAQLLLKNGSFTLQEIQAELDSLKKSSSRYSKYK